MKNTESLKQVSIPVSDVDSEKVILSIQSYDETQMTAAIKGLDLVIVPFDDAVSETELMLSVTDGEETASKTISISIEKSYSYFAGSNEVNGYELWKTDGTEAGTELVKDIYPGPNSSGPQDFYHWNNKVYFSARNSDSSPARLWVSDGTAEGTTELYVPQALTGVKYFAGKGEHVYFITQPENTRNTELWRTDGTEDGTNRVFKEVDHGLFGLASLYAFGDLLFFTAHGGDAVGTEIHTYNGSAVSLLKDINPGFRGGVHYRPHYFEYNDMLCFKAMDTYFNNELWCTDGTTEGTQEQFDLDSQNDSRSYGFSIIGDHLYFIARTYETGYEPYRFNGERVELLKDIRITPSSADSSQLDAGVATDYFTQVGNRIHFFATDGFSVNRWEINLDNPISSQNPYQTADPVKLGGFAMGHNGGFVFENNSDALWVRTETSAILLHNFQADQVKGDITTDTTFSRQRVNGKLLFGVKYGVATLQPWATDGKSSAQTTSLGNIDVMQIYR